MNASRSSPADLPADASGVHMDVAYVAHLARLDLTAEEAERFQHQLDDILRYVDRLRELDVEGVEPMAHAVPVRNMLRKDEPAGGLAPEQALMNAPLARQGLFIVPRIVE